MRVESILGFDEEQERREGKTHPSAQHDASEPPASHLALLEHPRSHIARRQRDQGVDQAGSGEDASNVRLPQLERWRVQMGLEDGVEAFEGHCAEEQRHNRHDPTEGQRLSDRLSFERRGGAAGNRNADEIGREHREDHGEDEQAQGHGRYHRRHELAVVEREGRPGFV